MKPKVVIWGADNYNTLGVLRSLAVGDFDVLMLVNGSRHKIATSSKYCHKFYIAHTIEEGIDFLVENYPIETDEKNKAVLIPGGDATSVASAEYYEVLKNRFHLMVTDDPNTLIEVTDKNVMGRKAQEAGLLVPAAQEYHVGVKEINVPFPALLKPVHSEKRVEFKTKVFESAEDLLKFSKYLNSDNRYLLQQFINKSHDIVVYGCKLPKGDLKLAGHHTLERWSDDGGGSYGHLSPDLPEYLRLDALNRFFDMIGYHGLFSAEYGFENGKAYFYEVNLRNDGFCHLSFQAGANLPLLWVCSCLGLPFTASYKMTKSVVGINEIYDVINVWKGKISWMKYRKDKKEAKAFHFYDPDDPQPYKNMHRRMFWELPMRAILKTFRPQIVWILRKIGK